MFTCIIIHTDQLYTTVTAHIYRAQQHFFMCLPSCHTKLDQQNKMIEYIYIVGPATSMTHTTHTTHKGKKSHNVREQPYIHHIKHKHMQYTTFIPHNTQSIKLAYTVSQLSDVDIE